MKTKRVMKNKSFELWKYLKVEKKIIENIDFSIAIKILSFF